MRLCISVVFLVLPSLVLSQDKVLAISPRLDPWYLGPKTQHIQSRPGSILRMRVAPGGVAQAYNASAAYNIMYSTIDSRFRPTYAVTTLLIPEGGIRSILLSYQIPYDSVDLDASPSYALSSGQNYSDIMQALQLGWYVSVPDYEGPLAAYTAGILAGHATLDSVRAVLAAGLGIAPNAKYAMWGYSGGALASEWAAELQMQYAPELNFAGAALGGLTPNVTSVLQAIDGTFEAGIIPAGVLGMAVQYPEYYAQLISRLKINGTHNASTFLSVYNDTLAASIATFAFQRIGDYFIGGLADLISGPTSQYIVNREGIMGYHGVPQMPILIYKAVADEISPIGDTDKLVHRYCEVGANILLQRNTIGTHISEEINGVGRALFFLQAVLNSTWSHTGCTNQSVTVSNDNATSISF